MDKNIQEAAPAVTQKEFCSAERLEQNWDNTYYQEFCKSVADLKGFPSADNLLVDQKKPDGSTVAKLSEVEKALFHTTMKLSNPDEKALEKVFTETTASEREKIRTAFEEKHHKPLLKEMADKLDPASKDYHNLKGLLLRTDSQNSMVAVQLHMLLKNIEKTSNDLNASDEGATAGYLRSPGKSGGLIATIDAIASVAGRASRHFQNKSLGEAVAKMTAQDVTEMKAEHLRIYRRDIGDMVENTPGLKKAAKELFKEKGIE